MIIFKHNQLPDERVIHAYDGVRKSIFLTKADYAIERDSPKFPDISKQLEQILIKYTGANVHVTSVTVEPLGTFHTIYRVTTPNERYVVKLNAFPDQYRELSFLLEHWVNIQLEQAGIVYCPTIATDVSRSFINTDILVQRLIPGDTLYSLAAGKELPPILLADVGSHIAKVHRLKCKGFGQISLQSLLAEGVARGQMNSWFEYLDTRFSDHIQFCIHQQILNADSLSILQSLSQTVKRKISVRQGCLLHGDVANHNIIADGNHVSAVLDWEDAVIGDSLYDVAYWGTASFGHDGWIKEFHTGYNAITPFSATDNLAYWFYFFRISLAKAVIRHKEQKDRSLTIARLKHSLSVLDGLLYNSRVLSACLSTV